MSSPFEDRVGWSIQEAERLLMSLQGVVSARVVARPGGQIDEIHLLTTADVKPKATVRNVESALLAHLDLSVDHRKISVAQTTADDRAKLPEPEPVVAPAPTLMTIGSDPEGAELYRDGALLGNTPFKLQKPSGSDQIQLELRRSGYENKPFLITSLSGDELRVSMSRKKSASRPPTPQPQQPTRPTRPGRPTQSEVLDPWD